MPGDEVAASRGKMAKVGPVAFLRDPGAGVQLACGTVPGGQKSGGVQSRAAFFHCLEGERHANVDRHPSWNRTTGRTERLAYSIGAPIWALPGLLEGGPDALHPGEGESLPVTPYQLGECR